MEKIKKRPRETLSHRTPGETLQPQLTRFTAPRLNGWMPTRYRKLILWIVAAVAIVVVWNWPSKWDRLEKWANEKDAAFQRRKYLREALLQARKNNGITSKELEKEELKPDGTLSGGEEELVEKAIPLPEPPGWVSELVEDQKRAQKK
jgi:hypothetical protein